MFITLLTGLFNWTFLFCLVFVWGFFLCWVELQPRCFCSQVCRRRKQWLVGPKEEDTIGICRLSCRLNRLIEIFPPPTEPYTLYKVESNLVRRKEWHPWMIQPKDIRVTCTECSWRYGGWMKSRQDCFLQSLEEDWSVVVESLPFTFHRLHLFVFWCNHAVLRKMGNPPGFLNISKCLQILLFLKTVQKTWPGHVFCVELNMFIILMCL